MTSYKPVCYGAETLKLENRDQAEDEGWCLAKHFKLHLHPQSMGTPEKLKLYRKDAKSARVLGMVSDRSLL